MCKTNQSGVWDSGYSAATGGLSRRKNPYSKEGAYRKKWFAGYDAGKEAMQTMTQISDVVEAVEAVKE